MKHMAIDFAPSSWRHAMGRLSPLGWLATCIGVVLCASTAYDAWHAEQRYRRLDTELQHFQALHDRQMTQRIPQPANPIGAAQADAVNTAIAQLNLPWRDVLDAVEAATPPAIALVALEPDAKKHLVRGQAEAGNSDAMIAYIEQLKHQTLFDSVILTQHEINLQDPNRPIRFRFEAHWVESAP